MLEILRRFRVLFWLQVFSAPELNQRPLQRQKRKPLGGKSA
jgi:hypothetical protein